MAFWAALLLAPAQTGPAEVPTTAVAALAIGSEAGAAPVCHMDLVAEKKRSRRPKDKNAIWFWELNKEPDPGWSGGPLIDKRGYLLGICSGRNDEKGYY